LNLLKYNTKEKNSIKYLDRRLIVAPEDTDEIISVADIYIPESFKRTKVKYYKIRKVLDHYNKYGGLDKAITVIPELNEQGSYNRFILVDEYSRYIVMFKILKSTYLPVKYIDIDTYCKEYNI
jgi:hypothetical protein